MNGNSTRLLFPCLVMTLMSNLFSVEARAEMRIGVLLFSEEVRYNESQKGIMDQLKKDGFGGPAVKYTMENAGGSKAKAMELAKKFVAAKMDLIIALGTHAAIAAMKTTKEVPIVFSTVYDPVEAGIAEDWKSSGNNTTGSSTRIPMSRLVDSLKAFAPVKRLAVLYTPGEKNSEAQLKELQKIQVNFQVKVIPIILATKEDVDQALSLAVHSADAIYLTGSGIIGELAPMIVDLATRAKAVTITHLDDLVGKGVLLGVCANTYRVGRLAGKKAVQVLKGAKPSSIPIEVDKKTDIILNMKTAKAGQFPISPKFIKTVTKTIE